MRSTLIIGITMPLSVFCTFFLIYFQGYTLNMVSFGGLALGVGMLVDNSIVVLESIFVYRDAGVPPKEAAIRGTDEVAMAIVASTLTSIIVFVPLFFLRGVTSVLLHQLAFVVIASQVSSLFVGLTLTPMLAAYLLEPHGKVATAVSFWARLSEGFGRFLQWLMTPARWLVSGLEWFYDSVLMWALRWPSVTLSLVVFIASCTLGLLPRIGTDFLPMTDDGRIAATGEMPPGIQIEELHRQSIELEQKIYDSAPKEILGVSGFMGDRVDEADRWHECRFMTQLVPREKRPGVTVEDVRKRLSDDLTNIAGMRIKVRASGAIPFFRGLGTEGEGVTVLVRGHDPVIAESLARLVKAKMQDIPGLVNVDLAQKTKRPELVARIDRCAGQQSGAECFQCFRDDGNRSPRNSRDRFSRRRR